MITNAWLSPTTPDPAQVPKLGVSEAVKITVHKRLLDTLDFVAARKMSVEQLQAECSRRVDVLLTEQRCPLTMPEKTQFVREVMDEIFGLGPLETLLGDPTVDDILVNGPSLVYVERFGKLEETDIRFRDNDHLMVVIQRIAANVGRRINESSPMLDARLSDGTRVNAIIPPLSLIGPSMSLRRFGDVPIDVQRLIALNSLTPEMAQFLEAAVRCKTNILISGGTGTGKTTFLNVMSKWIPRDERVVTIEDAAELQLQRKHVVRLESRPPNIEGKGEVTLRDLLKNSLRMRPDRIVIGEVRSAEALDMLQAMNTGHEGSMTTVHANSPRDAFRRVENMVTMAGLNYPVGVIRQQMAAALHLVIQLDRLTGGQRKVSRIEEVTGMEGEAICLQEIFAYRQTGIDPAGNAQGHFEVSGIRPQLLRRFEAEGVTFDPGFFQRRIVKPQQAGEHRPPVG